MRKGTLVLTFFLLGCCFLLSQTQPAPSPSPSSEDVSGMYSFLRDGEFVQLNVEEDHTLGGFISRYGDTDSDKGQFLDQFFDKASLEGNHVTFLTKYVHGVAYEFRGTVERGKAESRDLEGYLLLKGTLTEYRQDSEQKTKAKSREVEFRSFPAELSAP